MLNSADRARREQAALLFHHAVASVAPEALVQRVLRRRVDVVELVSANGTAAAYRLPALVIGAGKAAARMASACEGIIGPGAVSGCVVVSHGPAVGLRAIEALEAGHPLPDERGVAATRKIRDLVSAAREGTVIALISGGASSLLVAPRPPVTLGDKIKTTELLLKCGADISEINPVRKHLSLVKGGGLLRLTTQPMLTLMISDVVGDDPSIIGSGPTLPDPSSFADAWHVIERYGLSDAVPQSVRDLLFAGIAGTAEETPKPGQIRAGLHPVIGSNRGAMETAAAIARQQGWSICIEEQSLVGETKVAARTFAGRLREVAERGEPVCVLAGGETTVTVEGPGRGGRNQEFALAMVSAIRDLDICVLSAGTDGIDGPTDAAGAFVDGTTFERAAAAGLDPADALRRNDSYGFFDQLGDLFRCGPTGTNVMDVKIALCGAASIPGRHLGPVLRTPQ